MNPLIFLRFVNTLVAVELLKLSAFALAWNLTFAENVAHIVMRAWRWTENYQRRYDHSEDSLPISA